MRKKHLLLLALFLALGLGVASSAARIAGHYRGARLEVGRVRPSQVDAETRARLAALTDDVLATYYVSPRAEMPSELRRLEDQVTDVLAALEHASDGRFRYRILDPHAAEEVEPVDGQAQPEVAPEVARYAARQGIAPFRVRSITADAWSEKTIWSSLTLALGAHPPVVLNGVVSEHVPRLQATLVAHLDQMEEPRLPVVALAAPAGFERFAQELTRTAKVVRVDPAELAQGRAIPLESDVLFWLDPGAIDAGVLRELDRYLASGRSVVAAGHLFAPRFGPDRSSFRLEPSGFDAATLWGHFGLRPVAGLVCDANSVVERRGADDAGTPVPFLVRCIAPQQRFGLVMRGMPNGTLLFETPTPFALDGEVLADKGWTPEVLATSSDGTWVEPAAPHLGELGDVRALGPERGVAVSRQPLAVLLAPADPWRGSLVALASAACFRDDWLGAEGVAHRRLHEVLVKNLASDDRLVKNSSEAARPEPVPELGARQRVLWRALCIFLVPALLAATAVLRGNLRGAGRAFGRVARGSRPAMVLGLGLGLALCVCLVFVRATEFIPWRLDWTADGLNRLAGETVELARAARGANATSVELFVSRRAKLPPALRPAVDRLDDLFADLERAGAELTLTRVHPEEEPVEARERWLAEGIAPVRTSSREEGVTTVRSVYCALRLSSKGRSETLAFPDAAAFEELEFRVAFALWRLQSGRSPTLLFASDTPRLSPAEAHMDYQVKGLFAPVGQDPFSTARALLEQTGFVVQHVNPRAPELPADFDALLWFQPRREARPMIRAASQALHQGGKVLLAVQHFKLQARQYRGANFATVYWPQPQTPDVDLYLLPELGIELVREVLFDELKTRRRLETQVNRDSARRDYEDQDSALPFQIRASAANFADDPLTRGLGDLAFTWGNHIRWDEAKLAELGIAARPVVFTSERAWSFDWKGGYLPREVLGERPAAEGEGVSLLAREPLVVRFTGDFPRVEPLGDAPAEEAPAPALPERPAAPGELVLVGASEPFGDGALFDPDFRADHLLVQAAAHLALPAELAAVAGRRRVARGFDYVDAAKKREWRAIVLAAGPLALLAFGVLRALVRSRAPSLVRSRAANAGHRAGGAR